MGEDGLEFLGDILWTGGEMSTHGRKGRFT